MRDRIFVFLGGCLTGLTVGTVLSVIIGAESRSFLCSPPVKPTCVCKAEVCPTCPEKADASQPACPPQPTLEIRKPLSEELGVVAAACKPEVEHALAALEEVVTDSYAKMQAARTLGVSSLRYDWLESSDARVAGYALLDASWAVQRAEDVTYSAIMKCQERMEELFHATDAWAWIDSEEMDEALASGRGFAQAEHEFWSDSIWSAKCNAVARRLECPLPKPQPVEEEN